jgi:hypothetical protein
MNYFSEVLAPQDVNNAAVLCKVTHFIAKKKKLCIIADRNHFEQLLQAA